MSEIPNTSVDDLLGTRPQRSKKAKKIPLMGPIRINLEAFGVAILAAVLLKWFCIEAYQIPTSSMQPTLMGDNASGVKDRILVDKLLQTFREPKRWDITVFRYPLQKNQNYVKRIVGMPGDRMVIAGGNIYTIADDDKGHRTYTIQRKPDDLQEALWKEVYPARRIARNEPTALGLCWASSPSNSFQEDGDTLSTELSGTRVLYFRDDAGGGFIDQDWDGYPTAVAQAILPKTVPTQAPEIVPDGRLAATVTADGTLDELAFEFEVNRPGVDKLTFAFAVQGGQGTLVVRGPNNKIHGQSPSFPVALAAGAAVRLCFAHVDDQMVAWVGGKEVQRFPCEQWHCREGCIAGGSYKDGFKFASGQRVVPQIVAKGKGKVRFADLVLERDLHYTQWTAPDVVEVPEGHYYMMGDNTLQSVDSRGWTAITVGVTDDNRIVRPAPPGGTPGVRNVRGNKRAMPLDRAPDRDETPIAMPNEHAIVMIDEYGEILRLQGDAADRWGERIAFRDPDAQNGPGEWEAPDTTNAPGISFVPRADIQGRALMVFYPMRPISWLFGSAWPGRFGFVR
ncbi:MAG: signal peptidase I [Planctomycetota bacterium]